MKYFSLYFNLVFFFLLSACSYELPEEVMVEMEGLPETVDFNQHIRPILSDRCWNCHGPDAGSRQADLRLDTEEDAFLALASGAGYAIKRGSPGSSAIIERMISDDPELVMPTPESKMSVSPREIAMVAKWIEQGAGWKDHWAFLPIEDPEVPANPAGMAAANSIDHFINDRLQLEGLSPNERADDERLLRRVFLDLTGLPPRPWEMDAWLADPSEEHYVHLVDSLLQTSAHAERLTMEWLDLARYSDSHGMHADGARTAWPYRDWVINAFDQNMPFDAFVREQVAGDLLPEANQDTRIASAFNRMHPMTAEGGVIQEEMRLGYVFDRVNTVSTGLLGLTMDCSRCHDHKFDPIAQDEYYGFSAFFNNFNEMGMVGDDGDFGPYLLLGDSTTNAQIQAYKEQLTQLHRDRDQVSVSAEDLAAFLEKPTVNVPKPDYRLDFERVTKTSDGQQVSSHAWGTNELGVATDPERGKVADFTNPFADIFFDYNVWNYGATVPRTASLFIKTTKRDSALTQSLLGTAGHKNAQWQGSEFYLDNENRLNYRQIKSMPDDLFHVRSHDSVSVGTWQQVAFSYDGTGRAEGVKLFLNGKALDQTILINNLRGESYPLEDVSWNPAKSRKLRVGQSYRSFTGENGIFLGLIDDVLLYDQELSPAQVFKAYRADDPVPAPYLKAHHLKRDGTFVKLTNKIRETKKAQLDLQDPLRRIMISEEMDTPRKTYRLDRGAYDARAEEVFPTTPEDVLPFPEDFPANRIGLVDWMFLPDNPLTARVAVNRYWQLIFGEGIVDTPHDFGSQGSLPTHPELLDHLATSFQQNAWDIRGLLRQMVLSETYRRDSRMDENLREIDPANRLLAAGPSGRMPAEMIRDNALAASMMLTEQVGGPSVKPYQPKDLWIQANSFSAILLRYKASEGENLYRRSLYTFNRRTAPPPFMTNFDASSRDVCSVKRSQTNTPLQALNLLNDPQFVETARGLAQMVQFNESALKEQLAMAFRQVTGRQAKPKEVSILEELYADELSRFKENPSMADSLLAVGQLPFPAQLDRPKTAALTSVGNILFSFDEAYVKR